MKQGPLTIDRVSVVAGQQQLTPDDTKSVPYLSGEVLVLILSREIIEESKFKYEFKYDLEKSLVLLCWQ